MDSQRKKTAAPLPYSVSTCIASPNESAQPSQKIPKIRAMANFGVNNSDITLNLEINEIFVRYLWKVTCYFGYFY